nr:MAG: hypothetical protein 2 [Leviviridae sp.]
MFADPAVITINGVAKSLTRINQDGYSSEYVLRNALDEYRLFIRNKPRIDKKRGVSLDRHEVDLIHTIFPVAPATTSTIRKVYAVVENQQGDTLTDPVLTAAGLFGYLTATSNANLTKLMNSES